jgi:hypothetical protein
VELRVPGRRGAHAAGLTGSGPRTARYRAGRQTLTVNVARRIHRHAARVRVKVTAIERHGVRTTRTRTLRVR